MADDGIKRYARRLRLGVLAVFGVVVALILCGHFGIRVGSAPVLLRSQSIPIIGTFGLADIVLLLIGIAVYWLSEGLRAVATGRLFSKPVVRTFRLFASWMLIAALFNSFAPIVLAATSPGSPGRHRIMVPVDVRDLLLIALTLLLLLIARMFERARAIEDEMSEIV